MKPILSVVGIVLFAGVAFGQSPEEEIARATLAAPAALREGAMVIQLAADGSHEVLREGTNGLMCWDRSDEPERAFSVQCTSETNLARVSQNRAWRMSGKTEEEIRAMMDAAEADGSREVSEFGSVYYTLSGQDEDSANLHITIAVPFATSSSIGLPGEGSYTQAGSWIMEAGLSAAHIMVPGQ